MKRSQKTWIITIAVSQLLTAAIHSISYFVEPIAANETEKQFLDLFNNYRTDMGAGFSPSTAELFLCFNIAFTILFVFGGLINIALVKTSAPVSVVKAMVGIELFIYGAIFIATAVLTFLPPIVLTGLTFLISIAAYISLQKEKLN